jgi:CPA2 family monovalent cation:H+ antiporter-2
MALLFLILTIPVGVIVLPRLFEQIAALKSREVMIITTAAFALGTAYISTLFGLSLALGAFVAGIVVSESDFSQQIADEIVPLRDIFAGLFFVSVGMLIDPVFVVKHLPLVLVVLVMIVLVKGAISAGLVATFRFPPRVALLTGVVLAQSAEFSFLLARLGLDLDAISRPVYDTLLAGAVASILLAPGLLVIANPLASHLDRWFPTAGSAHDSAVPAGAADLRGHAVICGFGRVGQVVGEALRRRGFPIFVIESNPRIVRRLQKEGIMVLLGSADNRVLLDRAGLPRARVLVVAVPDATTTRAVVEYARETVPRLDIVVRTHSVAERARLEELGVTEAIIGELELALEMTRHTMHRFGVSTLETQAIIQ